MVQAGIIGLPNAGKSTLYNGLTQNHAPAESYPFTTIEPNVGIITVEDERLDSLSCILHPSHVIPSHIEVVDIAGLVKGAHHGEGLGNQFLSHIRNVDALLHVVRCFSSNDVPHVESVLDPVRDIELIHTELILADCGILERHIPKLKKSREKEDRDQAELLSGWLNDLQKGIPLRKIELNEAGTSYCRALGLLTYRPELYVANLGEAQEEEQETWARSVENRARDESVPCIRIHGRLEAELQELPTEDQRPFLEELGLEQPESSRLIQGAYSLLQLITFFTIENNILQAWPIRRGTMAPAAAGTIHSDMQKGFISADVISCRELLAAGSTAAARNAGTLRREGKKYEIQDGDICRIHFA